MKGVIGLIFIVQCVNLLKAYDNATTDSIDYNYTNQSNTLLYDVTNVTDNTLIITPTFTNDVTTKDLVNRKIDGHQETLQIERINAMSCDIPQLPPEYRLWKGNETNEMLIPKKALEMNLFEFIFFFN